MSASQRRKGKTFEQDVARRLRVLLPGVDVRRGWQSDGREAPDVQAGELAIECKHRKMPNVRGAMRDAEAHCPDGCRAIAICRWHGGEEIVSMRWDYFAEMQVRLMGAQQGERKT